MRRVDAIGCGVILSIWNLKLTNQQRRGSPKPTESVWRMDWSMKDCLHDGLLRRMRRLNSSLDSDPWSLGIAIAAIAAMWEGCGETR